MAAKSESVVLRTSNDDWFKDLAKAYKDEVPIHLIDDANVGINPESQTLLEMGKQADLSKQEWAGVLVSLGVAAAGVWMIVVAIADPDPTSKLGLLIGGGIIVTLTGGFSAIRILTRQTPPKVQMGKDGIIIEWE